MEVLESSDTRRYSVIFSKSVNKSAIFEEYQHDGMTIRLPLGELLFTVVESFGIMLNGSEQNSNLDSFFSDREYNLTKFFCDFSFDKNEAKRIVQIVNYLETIAIGKKIFNHYTLKNLFFTILPREHSFYYLFVLKPQCLGLRYVFFTGSFIPLADHIDAAPDRVRSHEHGDLVCAVRNHRFALRRNLHRHTVAAVPLHQNNLIFLADFCK